MGLWSCTAGATWCPSRRDSRRTVASACNLIVRCLVYMLYRGDLVSIETWFQKDSRISFERNWDIRDVKSGRRLGRATRCVHR